MAGEIKKVVGDEPTTFYLEQIDKAIPPRLLL